MIEEQKKKRKKKKPETIFTYKKQESDNSVVSFPQRIANMI